jgi:hypothetical protein
MSKSESALRYEGDVQAIGESLDNLATLAEDVEPKYRGVIGALVVLCSAVALGCGRIASAIEESHS